MTKKKLIELITNGSDIMFSVLGRSFTILTWTDDGIAIGEQSPNDNDLQYFKTPKNLVEQFKVNGVSLEKLVEQIKITQYS